METEPLPHVPDCAVCARLKATEEKARAERDPSREVDARVRARRHLRQAHDVVSVLGA
jgi:hypothetical protein